ncbi:MAG TPA: hypothetical protein VFN97_23615 [Actinospica sp.]|nr:hypothetical protein [Actinospica sp.]
MARTYLTTLSPRRRWGIASAAAGVVLAATAGLGEPWGYSSISGLPRDSGFSSVPLLASTLQVFHWTTAGSGLGGTKPWIAAFVLDVAWPLLILIGARALAGGLALRRARFSLIVGVWSVTTFTGAFAGVAAGLVDHAAGSRTISSMGAGHIGDVLALQAATMALVGVLVGWLPGVAAALAYSVGRKVPEPEPRTGEEETLTEANSTLSLESLEELRRARRDDGRMGDASTSEFFRV